MKKEYKNLNKREKETLRMIDIASRVVIKEDIKLLKELAKH